MAMTVMNNPSAMMTLGELNKNISNQGKSAKKLASGMKINSAGDDASAYSISERMRAQIRALDQDTNNVKNGRTLLKVAAGGIDNIVDELRNLKELALNAANDTNTDEDRATIQKEFDQKMANINDIASETNYNGKILLDGRYGIGKSINVFSQIEPTGKSAILSSGNCTILADGIFVLPKGFTGSINIANDVQNVELRQEDPTTSLNNVSIVGPSSGHVNLWIDGLNIDSTSGDSVIQFQGTDNFLTLRGQNTLSKVLGPKAIIDVGGGLTIEGDGILTSTFNFNNVPTSSTILTQLLARLTGASIGSNFDDASSANIIINSGTVNIVSLGGAGIGSGASGSIGNINVNGGNINIQHKCGVGIGAGVNGTAGDITIKRGATVSGTEIKLGNTSFPLLGPPDSVGNIILPQSSLPLIIHHGTKANQVLNCYINDMRTDALGLSNTKVSTRDDAIWALSNDKTGRVGAIDAAINYALDEATTIGAYISRLEFTEDNLVTANENTQFSESTIRDADMAKEMTEYTRSNVLAQASQSMLAQANQSASSVLSLLQ